jgi:hypothetical protein
MSSEFRSPMDDEIDDVARVMTAASPSAALRPAIRARITGHARARHAWRWSLATAAASGIIVLVLLWPGRERREEVPASRGAIAAIAPVPINPLAEPRPVVGGTAPVEPDTVRSRQAEIASGPPVQVDPLEWTPIEIPALDDSMLVVEGLQIEPLLLQQ